jgi:hypothetical protein
VTDVRENEVNVTQLNQQLQERLDQVTRELTGANRQVIELRQRLEQTIQEHIAFKQRCQERFNQEADRRQWCGEYDDIMVQLGFERRARNYDVIFTVTSELTISPLARDEDHAVTLACNALRMSEGDNWTFDRHTLEVTGVDWTVDAQEG